MIRQGVWLFNGGCQSANVLILQVMTSYSYSNRCRMNVPLPEEKRDCVQILGLPCCALKLHVYSLDIDDRAVRFFF